MFKTTLILGVPLYLILDYNRFDKNVLKPLRNYRVVLQQWNRLQTQEEFHEFVYDFSKGLVYTIPILGHYLDK